VARADNDNWDIATSVGATAVMVAMARAAETSSDHPLRRAEREQRGEDLSRLGQARMRRLVRRARLDYAGGGQP
jgi:hypothetical protein